MDFRDFNFIGELFAKCDLARIRNQFYHPQQDFVWVFLFFLKREQSFRIPSILLYSEKKQVVDFLERSTSLSSRVWLCLREIMINLSLAWLGKHLFSLWVTVTTRANFHIENYWGNRLSWSKRAKVLLAIEDISENVRESSEFTTVFCWSSIRKKVYRRV